jgi:hypothetical protein
MDGGRLRARRLEDLDQRPVPLDDLIGWLASLERGPTWFLERETGA